jgi:hypothetical protein
MCVVSAAALKRLVGSRVVANHVLFPGVAGYIDAMNRCESTVCAELSSGIPTVTAHACICSDLNFDTTVHTVVLEYNCLINDNFVESIRLAEARVPAEVASGPVFDPIGSIGGLGSKVTGAGSEVSMIHRLLLRVSWTFMHCSRLRTHFCVTDILPGFWQRHISHPRLQHH